MTVSTRAGALSTVLDWHVAATQNFRHTYDIRDPVVNQQARWVILRSKNTIARRDFESHHELQYREDGLAVSVMK